MLTRLLLFAFAAAQLPAAIILTSQNRYVDANGEIHSSDAAGPLELLAGSGTTSSAWISSSEISVDGFTLSLMTGINGIAEPYYAKGGYLSAFTLTTAHTFEMSAEVDCDFGGSGFIAITSGGSAVWGHSCEGTVTQTITLPAGDYELLAEAFASFDPSSGFGGLGGAAAFLFFPVATAVPEPTGLLLLAVPVALLAYGRYGSNPRRQRS